MITVLAGKNLTGFIEKVEIKELKKMENIALLEENFTDVLQTLLTNNYKIEIIAINDLTILEDKPLHIINIKLKS
jgi:hypothetical protein